jgi:hypothetical protein
MCRMCGAISIKLAPHGGSWLGKAPDEPGIWIECVSGLLARGEFKIGITQAADNKSQVSVSGRKPVRIDFD